MKKRFPRGVLYALFIVFLLLELNVFGSEKTQIAQCIKDAKLEKAAEKAMELSRGPAIYDCLFTWNPASCGTAGISVGSSVLEYFFNDIKAQCEKKVKSQWHWYTFWR